MYFVVSEFIICCEFAEVDLTIISFLKSGILPVMLHCFENLKSNNSIFVPIKVTSAQIVNTEQKRQMRFNILHFIF